MREKLFLILLFLIIDIVFGYLFVNKYDVIVLERKIALLIGFSLYMMFSGFVKINNILMLFNVKLKKGS